MAEYNVTTTEIPIYTGWPKYLLLVPGITLGRLSKTCFIRIMSLARYSRFFVFAITRKVIDVSNLKMVNLWFSRSEIIIICLLFYDSLNKV